MAGRRRRVDDVEYRLEVLRDLWARILEVWESRGSLSRDEVVSMLRGAYDKAGLEPIRGKAVPEDLYDKEMASLYVVGKHGMGLDSQYPELFDEVFHREVRYEAAARTLLGEPPERARVKVESLLGSISDNELARMLRLKMTEVYFGFADERELIDLIKAVAKAFPDRERIAVKYARFYTALMLARSISRGEVRSRIYKEAYKQAAAVKLGLHGVLPDDEYIADIARAVFGVPERVLRSALKLGGADKGGHGRGRAGERGG